MEPPQIHSSYAQVETFRNHTITCFICSLATPGYLSKYFLHKLIILLKQVIMKQSQEKSNACLSISIYL